jgi:Mg-chelatase subunit ChlI
VADVLLRKEIINRNLAFENDQTGFVEQFQQENDNLKNIIKLARTLLNKVEVKAEFYDIVVKLCAENKVDGHRADIGIIKTAKTHASFELKNEVKLRHIKQAAKFVLIHRTREGGLSKPLTTIEIDEYFNNIKLEEFERSATQKAGEINRDINLFADGGLIQQEKK